MISLVCACGLCLLEIRNFLVLTRLFEVGHSNLTRSPSDCAVAENVGVILYKIRDRLVLLYDSKSLICRKVINFHRLICHNVLRFFGDFNFVLDQ